MKTWIFLLLEAMKEAASEIQLRWKPKSGGLRGLLDAYTKEQLLDLCEMNRVTAQQSWKKGEIRDALAAAISDTLPERVLLFDEVRLTLMLDFTDRDFAFESIFCRTG